MASTAVRYTVQDLENFPNDGNRYELIRGVLHVSPGPGNPHQIICARLMNILFMALAMPGHAHVVGPGCIISEPDTQLEPDILVYPSRFSPETHWRDIGEHWLAVEVLSRSTRKYDREEKRDTYFDLGVAEVWLVDPVKKCIERSHERGAGATEKGVIDWRVPAVDVSVRVDLAQVFAGFK